MALPHGAAGRQTESATGTARRICPGIFVPVGRMRTSAAHHDSGERARSAGCPGMCAEDAAAGDRLHSPATLAALCTALRSHLTVLPGALAEQHPAALGR